MKKRVMNETEHELKLMKDKEKELKRIVEGHKKVLHTQGYDDEEYRLLYYQLVNSLDFLIEN